MFKQFLMEEAGGENGSTGGAAGSSGGAVQAANIADGASGAGSAQQSVGDSASGAGSGAGDDRSWLAALPDDIKADPSLAMFKDPASLAKSWVSAQKMMGAEKVVIPNEKSTEEDWNAFYKKVGRPESSDKYEIKAPEGQTINEEVTKGFKDLAFKMGLSAKQVAGLAEWNFGAVAAAQAAEQTTKANALRDSLNSYKETLGGEDKYMARVDSARVALRALAKPQLTEFLKTSGLGSRPEMIEFFAELKGMMSEDKIRDGTGVSFQGEDPAILAKELEAIETKMFSDVLNPRVNEWSEQAVKLRERLNAARQKTA